VDALVDALTHAGAATASTSGAPPSLALLSDVASAAASKLAILGYEPVVLPCHNMGCGDITYRR